MAIYSKVNLWNMPLIRFLLLGLILFKIIKLFG